MYKIISFLTLFLFISVTGFFLEGIKSVKSHPGTHNCAEIRAHRVARRYSRGGKVGATKPGPWT